MAADREEPTSQRRGKLISRTTFSGRLRDSKNRGDAKQQSRFNHPLCPHYPHCVGCPFIGLPYAEQLLRKRDILERAFAAYPPLAELEVPPVIAARHRLGYRARVKLVVRSTRGEVATGLYVPGTHRVIDISSCPVHPRPVNEVTRYLKKKTLEMGIVPYDERSDSGQLRYLDFRYSFARRDVSVALVTRHRDFPQGLPLARALKRTFSFVSGVVQNINEQRGNVIWGERYLLLAGRDTLMEQIGWLKLVFPVGVFSQANPSTAKNLYDTVVDMASLSGRETVLDLYCGVGSISLYLAKSARLVWGIDESSPSIDAAKQNARRNGVSNCNFLAGDVAEMVKQAKRLGAVHCVVLNPPRKGVHSTAMNAILDLAVARLIYVSCEPISLSRDLDRLVNQGYRLLRLQLFDLFPQTEQVESIALLEKIERGRAATNVE